MAIVTVTAVPCQMLRVIPIQVNDDPNRRIYAADCRCGARYLADSRDDATEAIKEHRFGTWESSGLHVKLEPAWPL